MYLTTTRLDLMYGVVLLSVDSCHIQLNFIGLQQKDS